MITVLLAAWQGAAYIEEQLDSILGQEGLESACENESGIRVLVSDDGSTDGTREILERYQKQHPGQIALKHRSPERKVKDLEDGIPAAAGNFFWLLSQAETLGMEGFNWNQGTSVENAGGICQNKSEYFMLSDQDDVWKKNKAAVLLAEMKRLEVEYGTDHPILVHSDMEVVNANLKTIHQSFFRYQKCDPSRVEFSKLLMENSVTGGAVMMNRALVELLRDRPAACFMHDWWIALAAACFGTISYVKEPLYLYRQHGNNTLGAKETGSIQEMTERLGRSEQVELNYRKMAAQAHAFGKMYEARMSEAQRATLRAYLALRYQSPIGRFRNIVKNRFFKSSMVQTLAQCVTIPRPDGGNWPI